MKTTVKLPFVRETKNTVIYALPNITAEVIGQIYVRKDRLTKAASGAWPVEITLTLETAE